MPRDQTPIGTCTAPTLPSNGSAGRRIVCVPGRAGGEPIIEGTRVPVKSVVLLSRAYPQVAEVLQALPMLTIGDVANALAYYRTHRDAIEAFIVADEASDAAPL
jgi:uncharacterized protein (DUF433 family)